VSNTSDLVYTTLGQPCRIIDTRLAGGRLTAVRSFRVAGTTLFAEQGGNAGGCGIPAGPAIAAMINFVAVNAQGAGNLKGAESARLLSGHELGHVRHSLRDSIR
jgi:hypothetical protein